MTTTMQTAQISTPGGDWEVVEREIPEPGPGHVRVKVEACGICHSDVFVKDGLWPGLEYPRVPGHEVAGHIDAVGDHVSAWRPGQRVGVGWHGRHCFVCDPCRRGDFAMCVQRKVTGVDFDGGYAEYMIARAETLAAIPDALPAEEASPFMCAGVTVYNALRHSGARPGEVVAVHGIGGLGHLGVQYARRMGFETVAINRGNDKEALARQLGAHYYIDALAQDAVTELQKLGGARVILATAPNAQAISAVVDGLAASGTLLVPAAPAEPLTINMLSLISGRRSVVGWYSGTARDAQDTLEFSALTGVHPMIETYPLHRVADAYEHMHSGRVRFRVVLTFKGGRIRTGLVRASGHRGGLRTVLPAVDDHRAQSAVRGSRRFGAMMDIVREWLAGYRNPPMSLASNTDGTHGMPFHHGPLLLHSYRQARS